MSSTFGAAPQPDPLRPTRPMPTKFKILVGMYVLSLLTTGVELYLDPGWLKGFALALTALILVSLLRGNEAMRKFVMFTAFIGLCISGVAMVLGLLVSLASPLAILGVLLSAYGVCRSAFVLWCLRQQDVQFWMYNKSMRGALDEQRQFS
ncbi:MAG: hypothetical protein U0414_17355 [Polyangiaceae bacterium]